MIRSIKHQTSNIKHQTSDIKHQTSDHQNFISTFFDQHKKERRREGKRRRREGMEEYIYATLWTVGICGSLAAAAAYFFQDKLVYFPINNVMYKPHMFHLQDYFEDITLPVEGNPNATISLWLFRHRNSLERPTFLCFHGNAGSESSSTLLSSSSSSSSFHLTKSRQRLCVG